MPTSAPAFRLVPFREVRHDQPDDCIHYEPVSTRFREMNWTIPAHCHEGLHQFQFLVAGTLSGTIDGQAFEAEAPMLLMLAPGSMHGFTYSHDAHGHQVTVPTATLRRLLEGSGMAEGWLGSSFSLRDIDAAPARRCSDLFDGIAAEFGGHGPGRVHSLLALTTLLAVHVARQRGERFGDDPRPGLRDTLLQRFLTLIERRYLDHWSLADYADALAVTPDHLSRSCKGVAGQSALQILHGRVLLEARRLLAYTPMTVAEVADRLGYADTAYFSRFFRRGVGHTPSAYRQLVAAGVRAAS